MSLSTSGSGNLPVRLTRFFGRESETVELEGALAHARLVTLTGAPGCGKSRLGVEVGQRVASRFRDGVWLVELAPLTDRECPADAVGIVLEITERPGRQMLDALVETLADRELLLIFDNCEHVAEHVAELVAGLRGGCPNVRILTTSRLALGLPGEQVWAVAPLEGEPGVELFVDRAQLVSSDFRVDEVGHNRIRRICNRLDGLPLAVELAAAWTRVLSPAQIAERLDDALPMLTTATRMTSPRQGTMEATVEWSYRLLLPAEQRLFARLSVFAGGFDLAAAEAVAGADEDVLAGLTALVDHSLVQAEPVSNEPMRYRILEPLRQYGAAALAAGTDRDVVPQHHAEHYLEVARRGDADLRAHDRRARALRLMEQDEGNFVAALEWARARPSIGLRLCAALAQFWELRGPISYCRKYMEEMLEANGVGAADLRLRGTVLSRAARLAWRQQDYGRARALFEESLTIARRLDDDLVVARRLRGLSIVDMIEGDTESAVARCEQSIATFRAHGDEHGLALALLHLGWTRYFEGDADAGDKHMREALAISRTVGHRPTIALSLAGLTYGAQLADSTTAAREYLVEAIAAVDKAGMIGTEPTWLYAGLVLAADEGRYDSALRLLGGVEALSRRRGVDLAAHFANRVRPRIDRAVREREAVADRLVAEGARMTMDELRAEAVAEPRAVADPLSRREREVVRLVAEGLTNAEIAEQLFISRRTVESHVDHIKQKLGHGSRSEMIAWAVRQSLDQAS